MNVIVVYIPWVIVYKAYMYKVEILEVALVRVCQQLSWLL